MTVRELYKFLEEKIPRTLSCDWDNDGLMVCANDKVEVKRVLVALDITAAVAEQAIKEGFHPVGLGRSRLRTETAGVVACHTAVLLNE
jgi:putative NIF3 family GTP cyclohydrolase 1 type 2